MQVVLFAYPIKLDITTRKSYKNSTTILLLLLLLQLCYDFQRSLECNQENTKFMS